MKYSWLLSNLEGIRKTCAIPICKAPEGRDGSTCNVNLSQNLCGQFAVVPKASSASPLTTYLSPDIQLGVTAHHDHPIPLEPDLFTSTTVFAACKVDSINSSRDLLRPREVGCTAIWRCLSRERVVILFRHKQSHIYPGHKCQLAPSMKLR